MSNKRRAEIYRGRVIDLGLETVDLSNGEQITLEIVRHPGGAVILPLDELDRVCLLRQYRHAVGGWIWELPAGVIEKGEKPIETARRELREEAGLVAQDWITLPSIFPTPGFCSEELFLYLAKTLRPVDSRPEPDEQIEVHWKTLEEATAMAVNGQIQDAKTIVALFRAKLYPN